MSQFRLVILDYAKKQLENPKAQKILSDMIFVKQKNFLRTDPQYVVMDKHDMIGTHYLIYDTVDFLNPRLVFAIRTTYLERSQEHRLQTPLMALVPTMEEALQKTFQKFHKRHQSLVDCNAWFVDPVFSKRNSGLNLSDIGYFMVCMNVMREGFDNIVGCTNETYHASRWLKNVGDMEKGLLFEHPVVKAPHMLSLVENFNLAHFSQVYHQHRALFEDLYEVFPQGGAPDEVSLPQYLENHFGASQIRRREDPSAA